MDQQIGNALADVSKPTGIATLRKTFGEAFEESSERRDTSTLSGIDQINDRGESTMHNVQERSEGVEQASHRLQVHRGNVSTDSSQRSLSVSERTTEGLTGLLGVLTIGLVHGGIELLEGDLTLTDQITKILFADPPGLSQSGGDVEAPRGERVQLRRHDSTVTSDSRKDTSNVTVLGRGHRSNTRDSQKGLLHLSSVTDIGCVELRSCSSGLVESVRSSVDRIHCGCLNGFNVGAKATKLEPSLLDVQGSIKATLDERLRNRCGELPPKVHSVDGELTDGGSTDDSHRGERSADPAYFSGNLGQVDVLNRPAQIFGPAGGILERILDSVKLQLRLEVVQDPQGILRCGFEPCVIEPHLKYEFIDSCHFTPPR